MASDAVVTAMCVNKDQEWRVKSRYSLSLSLDLSFSLSCQSVDQQQWLARAPRPVSARRRLATTGPPEMGRCDYGSWHLARLLSVKKTGMGEDRASAVAPARGALAVSQHKGGSESLFSSLFHTLVASRPGANTTRNSQQHPLSQAITTPQGKLQVHSTDERVASKLSGRKRRRHKRYYKCPLEMHFSLRFLTMPSRIQNNLPGPDKQTCKGRQNRAFRKPNKRARR